MLMNAAVPALAMGVALGAGAAVLDSALAAAQQTTAQSAAAISGVVRDAATGRPLADAVVSLHSADGRAQQPSQQFTDDKGRFVFADLRGGQRYGISAARPGFLAGTIGGAFDVPARRPLLELADGQWIQDADISLWPGGSISGLVTDDRGEPVAGVRVHVVPVIHVAGRRRLMIGPGTATDDRGRYRIGRLPPGRYLTMAPPAAHASAFSTPPSGLDTALELPPGGQLTSVDLRLTYAEGHAVSGTVHGPRQNPAGLALALLPAGLEEIGPQFAVATTRIRADGTFTFGNVPDGEYTLVTAGPRMPAGVDVLDLHGMSNLTALLLHGAGAAHWGQARVIVQGADVSDVVLAVQPTESLTVRLIVELDPGFPEPTQAPNVALEPAAGGPAVASVRLGRDATTPAPTVFRGILPMGYVFRSGSTGWTIRSVIAGGRDITRAGLDARGGLRISEATVTVTNAGPVLAGRVQSSGRIAAAVLLFPVERDRWVDHGLNPDRQSIAIASSSGAYRIADVPAGSYYAIAIPHARLDRWRDPDFLARAAGLATVVVLDWGRTTTKDLQVIDVR
jgi:hypothetical protein